VIRCLWDVFWARAIAATTRTKIWTPVLHFSFALLQFNWSLLCFKWPAFTRKLDLKWGKSVSSITRSSNVVKRRRLFKRTCRREQWGWESTEVKTSQQCYVFVRCICSILIIASTTHAHVQTRHSEQPPPAPFPHMPKKPECLLHQKIYKLNNFTHSKKKNS